MNAYLCTYCHRNRDPGELRRTREAAEQDPLLRRFLKEYDRTYYDWGDDPSFFAAEHLLSDVRMASWGVCRPDVRSTVGKGDVIVFFCGRKEEERFWRYYFLGFGVAREAVERADLWTKPAYKPYREFYNVLARLDGGHLVQSETFHPYHDEDWELRAQAPYVLFNGRSSSFNLSSPHCVATWDGGPIPEKWHSDDRSTAIEQILFIERGIKRKRRLRTSASGYQHAKLNLVVDARGKTRPGRSLSELTKALGPLVKG